MNIKIARTTLSTDTIEERYAVTIFYCGVDTTGNQTEILCVNVVEVLQRKLVREVASSLGWGQLLKLIAGHNCKDDQLN